MMRTPTFLKMHINSFEARQFLKEKYWFWNKKKKNSILQPKVAITKNEVFVGYMQLFL